MPHLLLRKLDLKPDLADYMQLGCMPRISITLLYVSLHYCRIIIEKKNERGPGCIVVDCTVVKKFIEVRVGAA